MDAKRRLRLGWGGSRKTASATPFVAAMGKWKPYDEVERIIAAGNESGYAEAHELLDRARVTFDSMMFFVQRFFYALCRARLASRQGLPDEAAAFAAGALYLVAADEHGPDFAHHPDLGRIDADQAVLAELWSYVQGGDPERVDPLVEEYRSPTNGRVQWHWSLVERLRPNPAIRAESDERVEALRRASRPLLAELRAAGIGAYDLHDFSRQKLPSKTAAEILVEWMQRTDNSLMRTFIANSLASPKARSVATQPLIAMYRELPDDAHEKEAVARALGTLMRDREFDQLVELLLDPRHTRNSGYLWWAMPYIKDPRAVDLCLDLLEDDRYKAAALGALGDLKSERARPIFERIAAEPTSPGRSDAEQQQRDRVKFAQKSLDKLNRAAAAGKARP